MDAALSAYGQQETLLGATVITGASQGIGRELALRFASFGSPLALTYSTNLAMVEATARECRERGSPLVSVLQLDLKNEYSISNAGFQIANQFDSISTFVNNAGIGIAKRFAQQTATEIREQIQVNLEGLMLWTQALLPHVRYSVINLGSVAAKFGAGNSVVYAASKFGVRGFTQALAIEYPHLYILCANPDRTATRMNQYAGRPAVEVAEVIFNATMSRYSIPSGGDIDVAELLKSAPHS